MTDLFNIRDTPPDPTAALNARECLDSLVADIKSVFGKRYSDAVAEAQGDISVNTAFKVAVQAEREDAKEQTAALLALVDEMWNLAKLHEECQESAATSDATYALRYFADKLAALLDGSSGGE